MDERLFHSSRVGCRLRRGHLSNICVVSDLFVPDQARSGLLRQARAGHVLSSYEM
ncbi:hypothetical protein M405DRAFT_826438 [Rhizopogon salebrosus TDB-379]|nr:hypothetical protein M405DRAFT_826438 [Rhizopogon salebrosus TDB-379]